MTTILIIYFSINLFFAGYYLADTLGWAQSRSEAIVCYLWCIGTIFFGCIYYIWDFVFGLLKSLYKTLQIQFWFMYFFTKELNDLKTHQLNRMNRISLYHFNKNTIHNRIYRYCTKLVNKRNNYNPDISLKEEINF